MAKTKATNHAAAAKEAYDKLAAQVAKWDTFIETLKLIVELGKELGFAVDIHSHKLRKAKPAKKAVKKAAKKVAPKRKISAAGRKRIAKAQRARWAKVHAAKKAKQAEKEAKKKVAK